MMIKYYFRALHQRIEHHQMLSFLYSKIIAINRLSLEEEQQLQWDEELRVNLLLAVSRIGTYEIKIQQPKLTFGASSEKSIYKDLHHRLQYIYDGTIVPINHTKGKIRPIDNISEIKRKWALRKKYILKDYESDTSLAYIAEREKIIEKDDDYIDIFFQYQHFGLLFFHAAEQGKEIRTRIVNIETQETENIYIRECPKYKATIDGIEQYNIEGEVVEQYSSDTILEQYGGSIYRREQEVLVEKVNIEMSYFKGNVKNEWVCNLCRIN